MQGQGHRRRGLLVSASALLVSAPVMGDAILEIHDASLTDYVPTSTSPIQGVRPLVDQRGVGIDGLARAGSTHRMALAGNPFGDLAGNVATVNGVRVDTGTFAVQAVDLRFPATVPWIIGRSYNCRQKTSGGSYTSSGGYQGENWFQSSQPELVFHDSGTDSEDMIYLVYGADRFIEFRRGDDAGVGDSTDTFRAVNGAAGAIRITTNGGSPDLATYTDPTGHQVVFFWHGDADTDDDVEGSIWKTVNPNGDAAYVGHETNAATAITNGFNTTTGAITEAYDSTGRRFTYTYTSGLLTDVTAEVNTGSWVEVGRVEYDYYVNADADGEDNDLKLVTVVMPLTDSGIDSTRKTYYRYYEGSYHATTNPGYHHQLRYIFGPEGVRNYDWTGDATLDEDFLAETEANLKPYAEAYFAYDTDRRIVSTWSSGSCGCGGAASGAHNFTYATNGSDLTPRAAPTRYVGYATVASSACSRLAAYSTGVR